MAAANCLTVLLTLLLPSWVTWTKFQVHSPSKVADLRSTSPLSSTQNFPGERTGLRAKSKAINQQELQLRIRVGGGMNYLTTTLVSSRALGGILCWEPPSWAEELLRSWPQPFLLRNVGHCSSLLLGQGKYNNSSLCLCSFQKLCFCASNPSSQTPAGK